MMDLINQAVVPPITEIKNINLNDHIILGTTDKDIFAMFKLRQGNQYYILPEPDLVVCLFECGRQYAMQVPDLRKKLIADLANTSDTMKNSYEFFSTCCLAVIPLVNALESFMNRMIPEDFEFISEEPQRKTIQNKEQIERNLTFEKKVKEVIPAATGKNFHLTFPDKYTLLYNLKQLRDEMTHMKSYHGGKGLLTYEDLYNTAFKFDYQAALNAVKFYINHYVEKLIEPCTCGADF